ncbi:MAG: hypothetical protein O7D95_02895 [Betaproteobacteria bacterium]|nr:hypothetical protein [Betaproteobacteria bacterium]
MGKIINTTYICDFCGVKSKDPNFRTKTHSGHAKIVLTGERSSVYQGVWGGHYYDKIEKDACFTCAEILKKFICELRPTK